MQLYKGETPSQGVSRFCKMLKLDEPLCATVRNAFYNRCLDSGLLHDDLLDTQDESQTLPAAGSARAQDHRGGDSSFWDNLYLTIADSINDYWNWIALVIVVLYVILHT